jgi:transposase
MNGKVKQRVIIKFFSSDGVDAIEILHRLLRAFQKNSHILSSVYEWIQAFKTGRTSVLDEHRAGRPRIDHSDSKILSVFQENESHCVRSLAQELSLSLRTVYARLIDASGFSLRHPRWVPHLLTDELKATRVATSVKMLEIVEQQE